jgi:hypothetical protein
MQIILLTIFLNLSFVFGTVLRNLHQSSSDDGSLNLPCLIFRCGKEIAKCFGSSKCRETSSCMKDCRADDKRCQSYCFFASSDQTFNDLVQCGINAKCIEGITWTKKKCPTEILSKYPRIKQFDVNAFADMENMVTSRGSHKVFDCFPCQKLKFTRASKGVDVYWTTTLNGVVRPAEYRLFQSGPNNIVTTYDLFGMSVKEDYYIIDYIPNKHVLYFYCGKGFGGEYQGR